jgi:hypothetical protein
MIAAASFGLRRSGTFATATSGAAYWAASVRHGPPWPLPVNAPKSIFQKFDPIQGRELSGFVFSPVFTLHVGPHAPLSRRIVPDKQARHSLDDTRARRWRVEG